MGTSELKWCQRCTTHKPFTEFHRNAAQPSGYSTYCAKCSNAIGHEKYRRLRSEDVVAGWAHYALMGAKARARKADLPFSLTLALLISMATPTCPVLGIPLDYSGKASRGRGSSGFDSPSVDRIIPERGYVPENVIVVSMRANLIKQNATPSEILQVGEFYAKLLHHSREDTNDNPGSGLRD